MAVLHSDAADEVDAVKAVSAVTASLHSRAAARASIAADEAAEAEDLARSAAVDDMVLTLSIVSDTVDAPRVACCAALSASPAAASASLVAAVIGAMPTSCDTETVERERGDGGVEDIEAKPSRRALSVSKRVDMTAIAAIADAWSAALRARADRTSSRMRASHRASMSVTLADVTVFGEEMADEVDDDADEEEDVLMSRSISQTLDLSVLTCMVSPWSMWFWFAKRVLIAIVADATWTSAR